MIAIYQLFFSSLKIFLTGNPSSCRFHPTCSEYCKQCFVNHTPVRAFYFSLKRILSCHPFSKVGFDPIPKNQTPTDDRK